MAIKEKRKSPRVKYPCKVFVSGSPEIYVLTTDNISTGGIRVKLPQAQPINAPLDIELTIGEKSIKTKGRIAWAQEKPVLSPKDKNAVDTGIEFTKLNPDDREFLRDLVESVMNKAH